MKKKGCYTQNDFGNIMITLLTNKLSDGDKQNLEVYKFTYHLYHMLHGDILHRSVMLHISTCRICYSILPGLPDLVLHDIRADSSVLHTKVFTLRAFIYDLNHEPQPYKNQAMNNMDLQP